MTLELRHGIAVRGTYRLSCRLGFEGGTSLTTRSASSFTANDGMG